MATDQTTFNYEPKVGTVRRSMAFSVLDRYSSGALNLITMVALARLLTPSEVGLFMLALGIVTMIESFRDFGVSVYLIQVRDVTRDDIRTAFTVSLGLSLAFAGIVFAFAEYAASLYGDPRLALVLHVATVGLLLAPFGNTIMALLRRNMAFDIIAVANVANSVVNCVVAITLAALGLGYMSMVWGAAIAVAVSTAILMRYGPGWWMVRPSLTGWRTILSFGGYSSLVALLNSISVSLPTLLLGRTTGLETVGLYNRALMLCQIPERLILNALQPVILPALSARRHAGGGLKEIYLRGLSLMSAVQWPFLIWLALMADPVVSLALGPQWSQAAPLLRIMAVASMSLFPALMTFPVLVSVGRIKDTLIASLISLPPSMLVVCSAAILGPEALAASLFLTGPFQIYVAMHFIRRHVPFAWRELGASLGKSVTVTLCAAAAPVAAVMLSGFRLDPPVWAMVVSGLGAAVGWLAGVFLTGHPMAAEMREAFNSALRLWENSPFLQRRAASR